MPDKLTSRQLKRARQVSHALFGSKHRLPMAIVVKWAHDEDLYAAALASRAGTTEVQARTELRKLADVGLLTEQPQAPSEGRRGRPPVRYARNPSAFWKLAVTLALEEPPVR